MEKYSITLETVAFSYPPQGERRSRLPVVKSVSFQCAVSSVLAVVGPSGCGKSTILNLIAGLLQPTNGCIEFPVSLGGDPRRTAYMFQSPHLIPWLTVHQNALFGADIGGTRTPEMERYCDERLSAYGLKGFENSLPHSLSGGMQQRVALLRALLSGAKVMLLDEPYTSSDFVLRRQLQLELSEAVDTRKLIAILVTHNLGEAVRLADKVVVLSERPAEVLEAFSIPIPRSARINGEADAIQRMAAYHLRLERAVLKSKPAQKESVL